MYSKIKSVLANDTVFYSFVIIGVAVTSFGLGRLSVSPTASPTPPVSAIRAIPAAVGPVSTSTVNASTSTAAAVTKPVGEQKFVASKSGSRYHFAWCPGAKQIKEANKIYFDTPAAARAAGYTPAANCPGLE